MEGRQCRLQKHRARGQLVLAIFALLLYDRQQNINPNRVGIRSGCGIPSGNLPATLSNNMQQTM
eukprot:4823995-Pleurochrysis_carterae.AAC.1